MGNKVMPFKQRMIEMSMLLFAIAVLVGVCFEIVLHPDLLMFLMRAVTYLLGFLFASAIIVGVLATILTMMSGIYRMVHNKSADDILKDHNVSKRELDEALKQQERDNG